jgi:hypothetical protein
LQIHHCVISWHGWLISSLEKVKAIETIELTRRVTAGVKIHGNIYAGMYHPTYRMSPNMKSFEVDSERVSFALDGFSSETLVQLRNAIDGILAARSITPAGQPFGLCSQSCDSSHYQMQSELSAPSGPCCHDEQERAPSS